MTTPPNQPDCPNVAKGGLGTAIVMFSIQKSSNDLTTTTSGGVELVDFGGLPACCTLRQIVAVRRLPTNQ
ncbi:hypothetical protein T02_8380 [Trichinella nativa]|uniref:Uncharacterized protein n=2 Tax=Trichinella TaxID=6333 RepID=A0A0V1KP95_9BILA|nr:hypothetical protein T05_6811 [Trichinella murrelli]KRZ49259.1 hypothetical protein T02_8380 [Trichinella nativa]